MKSPHDSSLGKSVDYPGNYDPSRLYSIERSTQRAQLGIGDSLPFHGVDVWNAYELSWLDARGKPQVALGEFRVPATSPRLIESKSLKLYLNSFNQERMGGTAAVGARISHDLSAAAGATVGVALRNAASFTGGTLTEFEGDCIDTLEIDVDHFAPPQPQLLRSAGGEPVDETLFSQLLKSNCPVTGQPDWASVQIRYRGPQIEREGLLRYLLSFRQHSDFHEHCVEQMFCDLLSRCAPTRLSVYARYTRRGGMDINPFRSTQDLPPVNRRGPRQ